MRQQYIAVALAALALLQGCNEKDELKEATAGFVQLGETKIFASAGENVSVSALVKSPQRCNFDGVFSPEVSQGDAAFIEVVKDEAKNGMAAAAIGRVLHEILPADVRVQVAVQPPSPNQLHSVKYRVEAVCDQAVEVAGALYGLPAAAGKMTAALQDVPGLRGVVFDALRPEMARVERGEEHKHQNDHRGHIGGLAQLRENEEAEPEGEANWFTDMVSVDRLLGRLMKRENPVLVELASKPRTGRAAPKNAHQTDLGAGLPDCPAGDGETGSEFARFEMGRDTCSGTVYFPNHFGDNVGIRRVQYHLHGDGYSNFDFGLNKPVTRDLDATLSQMSSTHEDIRAGSYYTFLMPGCYDVIITAEDWAGNTASCHQGYSLESPSLGSASSWSPVATRCLKRMTEGGWNMAGGATGSNDWSEHNNYGCPTTCPDKCATCDWHGHGPSDANTIHANLCGDRKGNDCETQSCLDCWTSPSDFCLPNTFDRIAPLASTVPDEAIVLQVAASSDCSFPEARDGNPLLYALNRGLLPQDWVDPDTPGKLNLPAGDALCGHTTSMITMCRTRLPFPIADEPASEENCYESCEATIETVNSQSCKFRGPGTYLIKISQEYRAGWAGCREHTQLLIRDPIRFVIRVIDAELPVVTCDPATTNEYLPIPWGQLATKPGGMPGMDWSHRSRDNCDGVVAENENYHIRQCSIWEDRDVCGSSELDTWQPITPDDCFGICGAGCTDGEKCPSSNGTQRCAPDYETTLWSSDRSGNVAADACTLHLHTSPELGSINITNPSCPQDIPPVSQPRNSPARPIPYYRETPPLSSCAVGGDYNSAEPHDGEPKCTGDSDGDCVHSCDKDGMVDCMMTSKYVEHINQVVGTHKHPSQVFHELHADDISDIEAVTFPDLAFGFVDLICWALCGDIPMDSRFIRFETKDSDISVDDRVAGRLSDWDEQMIFAYAGFPDARSSTTAGRVLPFVREDTIETDFGTSNKVVRIRSHAWPWGKTAFNVVLDPCSVAALAPVDEAECPAGTPAPGPAASRCISYARKTVEIEVKDEQIPEDGRKYRCRGYDAEPGQRDYDNYNSMISPYRICEGWNITAVLPSDYIDSKMWNSAGLTMLAATGNPCCVSEEGLQHQCRYLNPTEGYLGQDVTKFCMPVEEDPSTAATPSK